jgi:hypothetical protein
MNDYIILSFSMLCKLLAYSHLLRLHLVIVMLQNHLFPFQKLTVLLVINMLVFT